jgi:ABC-type lipoprotein release transport system permease subunit
MTSHHGSDVSSLTRRVALRYRREARRLLITGIILAVAVLGLGVLIVYGLDLTPGMPDALRAPSLI